MNKIFIFFYLCADVLRFHKIAHFNTPSLCYVCDTTFESERNHSLGRSISQHMAQHHKELCTPTGSYRPEAERSFLCSVCLQRFSSNSTLSWHLWKQHGDIEQRNFNCKICNLKTLSFAELKTHLLSSGHKQMRVTIQSLFVCVGCQALFSSRDAYAMHMMVRAQNECCSGAPSLAGKRPMRHNDVIGELVPKKSVEVKKKISPAPLSSSSAPKSQDHNQENVMTSPRKKDEGIMCPFCSHLFPAYNALLQHMHSCHTSIGEFLAFRHLIAQQVAPQADQLRMSSPRSRQKWFCSICGENRRSCDDLAMHVMDKHSKLVRSSQSLPFIAFRPPTSAQTALPRSRNTRNEWQRDSMPTIFRIS